jgi:predicted enzyme related to lactoylglutathione lyase
LTAAVHSVEGSAGLDRAGQNPIVALSIPAGSVRHLHEHAIPRDRRAAPGKPSRGASMPAPVVHFELRSHDPDATRAFYAELFGWSYGEGGLPGYTYVDTGVEGSIPGGIGPVQGGEPMAVYFVGVADVEESLRKAEELGGRIVQPATSVPGVTFGLLADAQGQVVGVASGG